MNKLLNIISGFIIFFLLFCFVTYNQSITSEKRQTSNTGTMVTPEPTTAEKNFTIGWSVYNSAYEFFKAMQDGVLAKAAELGINVITNDQKSSTVEMITGVTSLIDQGIDALVISPFNPDAMPVVVDLAKKAGIPVVVVDIGTGGTDVDAFIITDSFAGGSLAGEYALELIREHSIKSKNVAIIKVEETAAHARRRGEGFKDIMTQSGYNVAAEVTANSDQTQAYEAMKEILANYGDDLAVVFAENDRMALGAAQAIDEAGKKGQIMVIGFDGDPAAIAAIKDGLMQGTIAQQPFEMGALGVEVADRILTGRRIIFDDVESKELYVEIYLIDETGEPRRYME
ncbi:MAG: substrate-binding domain-containing protein [Anaerocolumna sp.]